MKICIDPGHGGFDPGAVGPSGVKEADVNLQVSLKLAEILKQKGHSVILTRTTKEDGIGKNVNDSLYQRVEIANSKKCDLFICIHCNSATPQAEGVETYCYKFGSKAEILAKFVQEFLVKATGEKNRGVKTASFYVLRKTIMPAILTEVGFISNPKTEQKLKDSKYQQIIAQAISEAVDAYIRRVGDLK